MKKFNEVVSESTPRLVVTYSADSSGAESYQWGVVHGDRIPVLNLLGQINKVQLELASDVSYSCPESALVIAWDSDSKEFHWFIHLDIPELSIIGMLAASKSLIVEGQVTRRIASQKVQLFGADGNPLKR